MQYIAMTSSIISDKLKYMLSFAYFRLKQLGLSKDSFKVSLHISFVLTNYFHEFFQLCYLPSKVCPSCVLKYFSAR